MTLVPKPKPRITTHHKKRVGAHHRQSKHYAKPYLPYLPLVAIVAVGVIANTLWTQHSTDVLGYATDVSVTDLLKDTNAERQTTHEGSLVLDSPLMAAAQAKANDMAKRNYWSHDTPDGKTPWTFMAAAGYDYASAGENLAYGFTSSSAILSGWMHSPEHRANILNGNFSQVGFGIANAANYQGSGPQTVVVAMYGEPAAPAAESASASSTTQSSAVLGEALPSRSSVQPPAQRISRVQELTGGASWSLFVVASLGACATIWFVLRHTLAWKRVIVQSEAFIVHHQLFDVFIVSVATLGFVLTRSAGFIH